MRARVANTGAGERRRRAADLRAALAERIEGRRAELEVAILTRITSDGAPTQATDPEYGEGLRAAVPIALEYCLEGIGREEANPPPIPTALRAQARVAARSGIALDVVLRRYLAGYTLLGDFLIGETEAAGLRRSAELQRLLRLLAASFDRLLAAVGEEYRRESESPTRSTERRRTELVERLLAGEPLAGSELGYDLAGHHLGLIAKGPGAEKVLRELASTRAYRLLLLGRDDDLIWAWLGRHNALDPERTIRHLAATLPPRVFLALGEPERDLAGWRLTHRQARAAMPIALRGPERIVRYADVALLAAALQDDLLASSLRQCLAPLKAERDGGQVLCRTLRAYFEAERNVSSAAVALGVNRNTVASRLRAIEERIGRSLACRTAELDTALRFDGLLRE